MDDLMLRQRSVASIPSKFETVLHEGGREKDGFWNRTHRFTYQDNELPGPGTYIAPATAEPQSTSYSKKGYGGMVSKSSRLPKPRRATAPPPGSYETDLAYSILHSKKDPSAVGASSSFSKPIVPESVKALRRKTHSQPGPGTYDVGAWQKAKKAAQEAKYAPFMTGAERWGVKYEIKKRDGTVVGTEGFEGAERPPEPDTSDMTKVRGAFADVLKNKMPSAAFQSRTGRKFERDKGFISLVDTLKPHPSQGPSLGIQVDIKPAIVHPDLPLPGPGSYEPFLAEQLLTLEKLRHSSMFSRTSLDRFGRPIQEKATHLVVPGPGAYHPEGDSSSVKIEASMSAFVSSSVRTVDGVKKGIAPGPAYYNPAPINKKSFHLNVTRRWL